MVLSEIQSIKNKSRKKLASAASDGTMKQCSVMCDVSFVSNNTGQAGYS